MQSSEISPMEHKLPILVFGRSELRRLLREVEALDGYFEQEKARLEGGEQPSLPKVSRVLDGLANDNGWNLLQDADRAALRDFLKTIDEKAPVITMSFATDPSSAFVAKLVAWLRLHIHPHILLQLGLQPNITVGCIVRVNSLSLDLSLREHFRSHRQTLIAELTKGLTPIAPAKPAHVERSDEVAKGIGHVVDQVVVTQ